MARDYVTLGPGRADDEGDGGGGRDDDRDADGRDGGRGTNAGLVTKTRTKTKKPSLYKVLLLNDDYTPIDRKSTRLNSSHSQQSRMPSSA